MLTSVGRAAIRRVVLTSTRSTTTSNLVAAPILANQSLTLALRPATAAHSFTTSQWSRKESSTSADATTTKKKTTTAKKPATKKKPAAKKKAPAKKKKKPAKAKKPVVKKKKPAKVLTPEEQQRKLKSELRSASLIKLEPKGRPINSWSVYLTEQVGERQTGERITNLVTSVRDSYAELSEQQKERLVAKGKANYENNKATLLAWVDTIPPETIYAANQARRRLSKLVGKHYSQLPDTRLPKRPGSAFSEFVREKAAEAHQEAADSTSAMRTIAQQWKGMTDAQKAPYSSSLEEKRKEYYEGIGAIRTALAEKKVSERDAAKAAKEAAKLNKEGP